ncbi:endonuclease [Helicobacter enhydrae]|uniref:endonuclease n=1 Tax=Helicobacter enhydrae TaxID=222136 RepID=UPI000A02B381|nr:endonuclease [Helicobacter enhydrae]
MKLFCSLFLSFFVIVILQAGAPSSFREAKLKLKEMYRQLGKAYQKDFYCQAPFKITSSGLIVQDSDRFTPRATKQKKQKQQKKRRKIKRCKRIEWEHIMPAQNFGQHFACWREAKAKGIDSRRYCEKTSPKFAQMEADLYNLVPAIGQINGDRSNFRYAQDTEGMTFGQYGKCQVKSDPAHKRFYPADYSKGFIARTYLYMSKKYHIPLSKQEYSLMRAWDKKISDDTTRKTDQIADLAPYGRGDCLLMILIEEFLGVCRSVENQRSPLWGSLCEFVV